MADVVTLITRDVGALACVLNFVVVILTFEIRTGESLVCDAFLTSIPTTVAE